MWLFPVGELNAATTDSVGYIDSVSYSFFEPNNGASCINVFNVDSLKMKDMAISTYQLAKPMKKFTFSYENIFHREYSQLDAFTYAVGGNLTSFHLANLSMGELYTGTVTVTSTVSILAGRLYSTILNNKANYVLAYNGTSFMVGTITAYSASSISFTRAFGANSVENPMLSPIYEVYMGEDTMNNFQTAAFNADTGTDGGWIWSGSISFISKYTV